MRSNRELVYLRPSGLIRARGNDCIYILLAYSSIMVGGVGYVMAFLYLRNPGHVGLRIAARVNGKVTGCTPVADALASRLYARLLAFMGRRLNARGSPIPRSPVESP